MAQLTSRAADVCLFMHAATHMLNSIGAPEPIVLVKMDNGYYFTMGGQSLEDLLARIEEAAAQIRTSLVEQAMDEKQDAAVN